ncbi:uncharacterized protein LOC129883431 [Solanum dulcamara]|uniref:uncharacterized protein LOC129883431 n=1 Tax=Solanum dulcamara TaxID=45834 RepID=UPI002485597E|nr:uncharacterized protein LOC129883431 [Solanum dulcamara]
MRVSNNFERHNSNNTAAANIRNKPSHTNPNQTITQNKPPSTNLPTPPNPVIPHTLATKLRAQEAMKADDIDITPPKITIKQGYPAVVLFLDLATYKKTRGSVAKVKIQIDLTKQRPQHIWMGFDEDENGDGRWQSIQYEGVPDYCTYCKHQGHTIHACTVKRRDDDNKKKNEQEEETRNTDKTITDKRNALHHATDQHKRRGKKDIQHNQGIRTTGAQAKGKYVPVHQNNNGPGKILTSNVTSNNYADLVPQDQPTNHVQQNHGKHHQQHTQQHKTQGFMLLGESSVPLQHNTNSNHQRKNQQQAEEDELRSNNLNDTVQGNMTNIQVNKGQRQQTEVLVTEQNMGEDQTPNIRQPSGNYALVPEQSGIHVTPLQTEDTSNEIQATPLQIHDLSNERQVLSKEDSSEDLSDEYRVTHSEDEEDPNQWEDEQ